MRKLPDKIFKGKDFGSTYIFKEKIAKEYGLESSILIQHFIYSITHHKINRTHFYEGRYWAYHSISSLLNLYPFLSTKRIRRIINLLLEKNVLISGNFNKNKYDRTKWFAFQDEDKFIFVDKSVDNYEYPVDNTVDSIGIKNNNQLEKKSGNEPFISKISLETRRNGHLPSGANGFVPEGKPIPLYTSMYSSIEEGGTANSHNRGNLEKDHRGKNSRYPGNNKLQAFSDIIKPRFATTITTGYILPLSLRKKIHELGYNFPDEEIDKEILNMIRYHEESPQIIFNEHSCVLGWFKKSLKMKKIEKR